MHRVHIRDDASASSSDDDTMTPATAAPIEHRSVSAAEHASQQAAFHEYLFSFGDQYAAHKEALRAQRQAQELATLQSVPRISPHAQNKVRDTPIEQRLFELQKKHAERLEEAKLRIEEDRKAKMMEECGGYVGHPNITPWAQQLKRRGQGESIAESSAKWIDEHKKRMAALQEDALKRELAELRPTPRISSGSVASTGGALDDRLPIEERLVLQERERQRRMYAQVEKEIQDAKRNARPHINHSSNTASQRSASAAGKASSTADSLEPQQNAADVVSRLYNPNYKAPMYDAELVEKCTFQPRVYSRVDPNDELMKLPVHERLLKRHQAAKESHLNKTIQQARLQAAADNIGTPRISAKSRQLASMVATATSPTSATAASLTSSARFGGSPTDRLYKDAQVRQQQLQEKVKKRRAESADPKPKLSKKSLELVTQNPLFVAHGAGPVNAAGSPTHGDAAAQHSATRSFSARQRLYDKKRADLERQRKAERSARDEAELEECTFHPEFERVREATRPKGKAKVTASEERVLRRRPAPTEKDFYRRNERWMAERDRRRDAAKATREQLELAECDFHPTIHTEVPLPSATVHAAPGMESHIKRQADARREREIKEAGGHHALQRKLAAEAAEALGVSRRTTQPEVFDFRLPANQAAVEGNARRGDQPRTPRTGRDAPLSALRPPVTAADVEAFYEHGDYAAQYEAGRNQQQGLSGGVAAGQGFFGGAYGEAPSHHPQQYQGGRSASAQSQASSVQHAYDVGVAALTHQPHAVASHGWGGGVSVEAIIRNHQDIYRRTAAAAAGR